MKRIILPVRFEPRGQKMVDITAVTDSIALLALFLAFICAPAVFPSVLASKGKSRRFPPIPLSGKGKPFHGSLFCLHLSLLALSLMIAPVGEARPVKDQSGREVSVPDDPARIVSLAPSITEMVFSLGKGDRLKGVTQHCDFPPEARSLPKVGSYVRPDLERIVALKPDLCIATKDGNPRDVVESLQALGIPVYVVNPRDLDTVVNTLVEIGELLNAEHKARDLAGEMRARIERVKTRVARAVRRPRVFFQIGVVPIVSVGADTFIHELITTAGGTNAAEGTTPYPRFSREQVLELSPEVIIITSMTRGQVFEEVRDEWKKWNRLPAVRDERIFIVESNLFDRPTPRLIEGLELLAGLIHPELF
jgi:iron complex transport system substrate-binding protein